MSHLQKKLTLALATVAIGIGSYWVFSLGDRRSRRPIESGTPEAVRRFVTPVTSQPMKSFSDAEMTFSPGEQTKVRVYDDVTGRLKYQFEARLWEPTSNTDFDLKDVLVQIFMPRGEITYISADDAHITLERKGRNRVEPQHGWMKNNVQVVIDRTSAAWREAHPDLASRDAHPEDLIHIRMEEARFDLEQAELHSDGPVFLDSIEARIEDVRGLNVQWNQVDGRIDVLRFQQGGKIVMRRGGRMIDFGLPGAERAVDRQAESAVRPSGSTRPGAEATTTLATQVSRAQANRPVAVDTISADAAATQIRLEGGTPMPNKPRSVSDADARQGPAPARTAARDADPNSVTAAVDSLQSEARKAVAGETIQVVTRNALEQSSKRRIQTYRAVFNNQVIVEQRDGSKTIGRLEADKLELNFDFGRQQREMASNSSRKDQPSSRPASNAPATTTVPGKPETLDATQLTLIWNGPLELRPLRVDPAEQTGQRFDAVATGDLVKISGEQGDGSCKQLVYRHERRQVWLSGEAARPVRLALGGSKRLIAAEVFFDQKRGLAHIEGAGSMQDDRTQGTGGNSLFASEKRAADSGKPVVMGTKTIARVEPKASTGKPRPPVEITWSRGVDIEIGSRPVQRFNSVTGAREEKQKEFLKRAWFEGDVTMKQGDERLSGQAVAVTFGTPQTGEDVADHIQHLNMKGEVRLQREHDLLVAEKLDIEMVVTPDGRNVPRTVDAEGDVLAQQGRRLIRAEKLRTTMGQVLMPGPTVVKGDMLVQESKTGVGVETLDAEGRVFVHDPDNNLKIRDARVLRCTMKNGSELVRALVESDSADRFAKVRAGDTAVHGRRIDIDAMTESLDVPGPGVAWMRTDQDFSGRKLSKPSPVRIAWSGEMRLRGDQHYGVFLGDVRSRSSAFSLACDKLTVRLADLPPAPPAKPLRDSIMDYFWLTRRMNLAASSQRAPRELARMAPRKRPTYIVAEGHAEALSNTYAPRTPDGRHGRLLSRMQITGQRIVADLARERMSTPCKGTLLIEDYQFERDKRRAPSAAARSGPLMSSAQGQGPSQSLVTWDNSMDYYMDQNLVAFDQNVSMVHRSGQELVLREELARGMNVDPATMKTFRTGRRASMTAGYLLLEFANTPKKDDRGESPRPAVRATDLNRMIAKHSVHLQDGTKSLMGEYLQFIAQTDEVQVEGAPGVEARIIDQDERDQRMNMWRGPILIWNRKTNRIEAPQATIRTTRR